MRINRSLDIQMRLQDLNYYKGTIDADLGLMSTKAIKLFQKNNYLSPDGYCGKKTYSKLKNVTKDSFLYMFLHCSATKPNQKWKGKPLGGKWVNWLHTVHKGWSRPGYSDLYLENGLVENIWDYNANGKLEHSEFTWGVKGSTLLNRNARHVCYIGGLDKDTGKAKDTRTEGQLKVMAADIIALVARNPNVKILGHNQVQYKGCPCFDVPEWLESIGITEKNYVKFDLNKI